MGLHTQKLNIPEQEGGGDALVLGSETLDTVIETNIDFLSLARTAFMAKAKMDHGQIRTRILVLELANILQEIFPGLSIPVEALGSKPEITVVIGGSPYTFRISESILHRDTVPDYDIFVLIRCSFCERGNWRAFKGLAGFGEVVGAPTGTCQHCGKVILPR